MWRRGLLLVDEVGDVCHGRALWGYRNPSKCRNGGIYKNMTIQWKRSSTLRITNFYKNMDWDYGALAPRITSTGPLVHSPPDGSSERPFPRRHSTVGCVAGGHGTIPAFSQKDNQEPTELRGQIFCVFVRTKNRRLWCLSGGGFWKGTTPKKINSKKN